MSVYINVSSNDVIIIKTGEEKACWYRTCLLLAQENAFGERIIDFK